MSEPTPFDPNAPMPIETFLGGPLYALVMDWRSAEPMPRVDEDVLAHAPAVLDAIATITTPPDLPELRRALDARDPRALGALVGISGFLETTCDALIERCTRWRNEREWETLRHEASIAARLAVGAGQARRRALALSLLAQGHRARGDTAAAIREYEEAIAAATEAGAEDLLATVNDNLGNALANVGRLDEALHRYDLALEHERELRGKRIIRTNRANALVALGELSAAARTLQETVDELERSRATNRELAIALDNASSPLLRRGEVAAALAMLERARGLFDPGDFYGRIVNALTRSHAYADAGDDSAAGSAFVEAHDLALELARSDIDIDHYRRGFAAARAARLPPDDDAHRLFIEGIGAKDAGAPAAALEPWQEANRRARDGGDHALALRIDANAAAVFADAGQADKALAICNRVRQEASARGLARPELMAITTLASIVASGAASEPAGPLVPLAAAAALLEVHRAVVAESGLEAAEAEFEASDPGTIQAQLAKLAQENHARDLAIGYYGEAVAIARAVDPRFRLVNRLAGLRAVLAETGAVVEADDTAREIEQLVSEGRLSDRGLLVAHRALGYHVEHRDQAAAIEHLRASSAAAERLRLTIAPGPERADVARHAPGIHRKLATLLRKARDDRGAFEALQGEKGRRLVDSLAAAAATDANVADTPATAAEVVEILRRLGRGDTQLIDLAIEEEGLTAYVVGEEGVRAVHAPGDPEVLRAADRGDVREREARIAALCLHEPLLRTLTAAVAAELPPGRRLLVVPDLVLHNFPLHAIPIGEEAWCDRDSIAYLAAAGTLRFAPGLRPAVGRSLVAGDSAGDLKHAAHECEVVGSLLDTTPLLRENCNTAAVKEILSAGELDVVHLAVHGRGDAIRGGRASLLFADGRGGTEWIPFDELAALTWRVEFVVFSGCSTAVAGPRQGHELVGIARAAAEAGAAAVVACLWPVGDESAAVFMESFYRSLVTARANGPADLRLVLDEARKSLRAWLQTAPGSGARRRDGRGISLYPAEIQEYEPDDPELSEVLEWSPFVLLGDPILGG